MNAMSYTEWQNTSPAYQAYLAASERCAKAFAPQPTEDNTDEFLDDVWAAFTASLYAPSAKTHLNRLIGQLENRETADLTDIDLATVHLSDSDWDRMTRKMRIQAACPSF